MFHIIVKGSQAARAGCGLGGVSMGKLGWGSFWLAVHGKPVLFWKGNSGLKFPCFLFMHANGTGPFEFRAVPIL